jgi:hypothetical protein
MFRNCFRKLPGQRRSVTFCANSVFGATALGIPVEILQRVMTRCM